MSGITPVDWKTLVKVFELYGCLYRRNIAQGRLHPAGRQRQPHSLVAPKSQ